MDDDLISDVEKDAQREGLSLNLKINDVLKKHVLFYRYYEQQQSIVIPSKNFASLINHVNEDMLREEFKTVVLDIVPSEFLIEQKISLNLDNWIKFVFAVQHKI